MMMIYTVLAMCALTFTAPAFSLRPPSYIKVCGRNDTMLDECALKSGKEALSSIIQGDTKYGIPNFNPFVLEKIVIGEENKNTAGIGISLTCEKCKIFGLKDAHLTSMRMDPKMQHIQIKAIIPKMEIKGEYKASGKVLILPIQGNGDAEITLIDLDFDYNVDYELKKGKDNKDHINLKKSKLDFKVSGFKIHLTNLFNGDKNLGQQMNKFLNENWGEVIKEFGPTIADAVGEIITLIVNNVMEKVPYDEILPK